MQLKSWHTFHDSIKVPGNFALSETLGLFARMEYFSIDSFNINSPKLRFNRESRISRSETFIFHPLLLLSRQIFIFMQIILVEIFTNRGLIYRLW